MREKQIIEEMTLLAEKVGLSIKFDEFDGKGGWCRVKGTEKVIINKRLSAREQIKILAQILSRYPVDEQATAPKVRQLIEEAREDAGDKEGSPTEMEVKEE